MIKYNGCENEGHHIDPFLCCGQTEQILKDLKGFRDGFDLSELLNLDNKEEKGSSVPYDSQWI